MRTIIETDATTVRMRQHSGRKKKKIILALMTISIVLICSILMFAYFYKGNVNEYDSKKLQQEDRTPLEKSIHYVANNNNGTHRGIVNYAQKGLPKICSKTTWFKTAITVVGGNGLGSAMNQLAQPNDMFVDDQNAIYIADSFNHRIVKWDEGARQGCVVAGGNGKGNQGNQLNYPTAVFVDRLKNIYVADNANNRIQKWPKNGKNGETVIGQFGRGNRLYQIDNCWGLYVDREHNVYVSELSNNRITKWLPGAQSGQIVVRTYAPRGIYVHEKTGDIYVASDGENSIKQFAADGSLIRDVGKGLDKSPHGVITIADALSKDIYVFIADIEHHRILRMQISNHNNMKTIAGTNNISGNQSNKLDKPIKVRFDSRGNLLLLDFNNQRVQKFSVKNKNRGSSSDYAPPIHTSDSRTTSEGEGAVRNLKKYQNRYVDRSTLRLSQYSTPSTYAGFRPNLYNILQSQGQKTSGKASSSDKKNMPISDNFFPKPSFGGSLSRESSFGGSLSRESSFRGSLSRESSFRGSLPRVSSRGRSLPRVSSFRGRGGRRG